MKTDFFNINFEITHRCNQKCQYCYNSWLRNNTDSVESIKTIRALYQKANTKQLTISGGEPMLSEYLIECILHAKLNNSKVVVITNASIINDELYKELINIGVDFQITINSVDSNIHDFLSGVSGSLVNVKKNIELILSKNGKITPTIILTKKNIATLEITVEYMKECNMNTIIINRYNLSNNPFNQYITLNHDELRWAFQKVNQLSKQHNLTISSNVCTPHCILSPKDYSNIYFGQCPDDPKMKPLTVDCMGDFRLCNHSPKILGNIHKDSFKDMLYSDYSMSWISSIPEYCIDCEKYDDCKGGCKAAAEQIEGTKDKVDPILTLYKTQPLINKILSGSQDSVSCC